MKTQVVLVGGEYQKRTWNAVAEEWDYTSLGPINAELQTCAIPAEPLPRIETLDTCEDYREHLAIAAERWAEGAALRHEESLGADAAMLDELYAFRY